MQAAKKRLNIPCPSGEKYDDHQIEAARWIHQTKGNVFVCDDMGQGKTVSIIAYLNLIRQKSKILIVCTAKGVNDVWLPHLTRWHVLKPSVAVYHPNEQFFDADILIVHYFWLSFREVRDEIFFHFPFDIMICDEFHSRRSKESKGAKNLLATETKRADGLVISMRAKAKRKIIAASGTPIFSRPENLWIWLKSLRPDALPGMSYQAFGVEYCNGFWDADKNEWNFQGASNVEDLARRLRFCMIRRTGGQNLPKLHDPEIVYLNPNPKAKEIISRLSKFDEDVVLRSGSFNEEKKEIATLRRELGLFKIKPCAKWIIKRIDEGAGPILVFAYHRDVVRQLTDRLRDAGINVVPLPGGISGKKAAEKIAEFQREKPGSRCAAVASLGSFNDSVTMTASNRPIFVELSGIWNQVMQAIKRTHRRGQTREVYPEFLVFEKTYDERLLKQNFERRKVNHDFEQGSRARSR